MRTLILFAAAAVLLPGAMIGQSLDIRGAGCIGPCHSIGCCGTHIVVNENGVGFGRDVDCRAFMESATADQRSTFCSLVRDLAQTASPTAEPRSTTLLECVKEALRKILPQAQTLPDSLEVSGVDLDTLEVAHGTEASTKEKIQLDNETLLRAPCSLPFALEVALEVRRLAWKNRMDDMGLFGEEEIDQGVDEEAERREIFEILDREYGETGLPCCKDFKLPEPSPDLTEFCPEIAPYCEPEVPDTVSGSR